MAVCASRRCWTARGRPPCDRQALAHLLGRVVRIMLALPEIEEIDLNPVFALSEGAAIADVRITLRNE